MRKLASRRFLLVATTLVGAGLLAIAGVLQQREAQRAAAPLPEPAWRSADRSAAFLRNQLRPFAAADSAALARVAGHLHGCRFLDPATDPIHFHMTRALNSGHEFEAEVVLARRALPEGQQLELRVRRGNGAALHLRVGLQDGAIVAVEQATDSAATWRPWTGRQDLPLALGDLQLDEVLELGRAFDRGALVPVGRLEGLGSQPQFVLEASLDTTAVLSGSPAGSTPSPAVGAAALVYVDAQTGQVRSVRILDAKGYVVRVYEDLVWDPSGPQPFLAALQVTSIAGSSRTLFRRGGGGDGAASGAARTNPPGDANAAPE